MDGGEQVKQALRRLQKASESDEVDEEGIVGFLRGQLARMPHA